MLREMWLDYPNLHPETYDLRYVNWDFELRSSNPERTRLIKGWEAILARYQQECFDKPGAKGEWYLEFRDEAGQRINGVQCEIMDEIPQSPLSFEEPRYNSKKIVVNGEYRFKVNARPFLINVATEGYEYITLALLRERKRFEQTWYANADLWLCSESLRPPAYEGGPVRVTLFRRQVADGRGVFDTKNPSRFWPNREYEIKRSNVNLDEYPVICRSDQINKMLRLKKRGNYILNNGKKEIVNVFDFRSGVDVGFKLCRESGDTGDNKIKFFYSDNELGILFPIAEGPYEFRFFSEPKLNRENWSPDGKFHTTKAFYEEYNKRKRSGVVNP